jgi:hypothetical protein
VLVTSHGFFTFQNIGILQGVEFMSEVKTTRSLIIHMYNLYRIKVVFKVDSASGNFELRKDFYDFLEKTFFHIFEF